MPPHAERPLVYVAGPYAGALGTDPVQNTRSAIRTADVLQETGLVTAYVPHLNLLWDMVTPQSAETWYSYDLAFLKRCDALYRIRRESKGSDDEEDFAKDHSIPIFYDAEALFQWATDWIKSGASSTNGLAVQKARR